MKKTVAIIGIIVLAAGASFARGPRGENAFDGLGGCMNSYGSDRAWGEGRSKGRGHKGMAMHGGMGMGMHGGMGMGMHGGMGNLDDAQVTAFLKAQGVSDADITKALTLQKEKAALMERYWESSVRQDMKDRGMSDADITRLIQLQKDMRALQDKYTSAAK